MTLQEMAWLMGVTRERIRQLEEQATKKMKHPRVGKALVAYTEIKIPHYVNEGETGETV